MKATLWGGPHDGLTLEVDRTSPLLRMPVAPDSLARPSDMDITTVTVMIARYVRVDNSTSYTYAGQEPM